MAIDNYFKCMWTKLSNQKTGSGQMDKKTQARLYAACNRLNLMWGHTQAESEGLGKNVPCKQIPKESWRSSACIGQNRLLKKKEKKAVIKDKDGR